jgi:hypothetical protein
MAGVSYQLWFMVRYVHIASAAVLAGGALLTAAVCSTAAGADIGVLTTVASAYEWTFWSLVGIVAATGISNLGLKGEGLLGPDTSWGAALSVKLGAALFLLALSFVRTDIIAGGRPASRIHDGRLRRVLTALYAATGLTLLAVLWLGLGLAHGRY